MPCMFHASEVGHACSAQAFQQSHSCAAAAVLKAPGPVHAGCFRIAFTEASGVRPGMQHTAALTSSKQLRLACGLPPPSNFGGHPTKHGDTTTQRPHLRDVARGVLRQARSFLSSAQANVRAPVPHQVAPEDQVVIRPGWGGHTGAVGGAGRVHLRQGRCRCKGCGTQSGVVVRAEDHSLGPRLFQTQAHVGAVTGLLY